MAASLSYRSCSFCELSADPADTNCMSCGGLLGVGNQRIDSNEILLNLITHVNTILVSKTRGIIGTQKELKMNFVTGALCTVWVLTCLIVFNMQSFGPMVFGGDTTVAVRMIDEANGVTLEPSLQAALEGR